MKYRELGHSGIQASVVGLGTWAIGGGSVWGNEPDDTVSIRAIQAAIDAGVTLIDTAPAYGFGHSEEIIGRAIRGRREQVVLATKCGLWWDGRRGSYTMRFDGKRLFRSLQPDTLRIEIENSLRRLDVETIDLYQTHWPATDPDKTPIPETIEAMQLMKAEGKIRAIGVSNVSLDELRENIACGEIDTNQPRFNLLNREIEQEVVPLCKAHGVSILAYMPLEQGLLTGAVGLEREFQSGEFRRNYEWNPWFTAENRRRVLAMLASWTDLTEKYACTLAQLTVAWTTAQSGITHILCGARNPQQAIENAQGAEIELEQGDQQRMRADAEALGPPV